MFVSKDRIPFFLWFCLKNSMRNKPHQKSNRFDPEFAHIATYIYIRGGKHLYEFFVENLCLPSTKEIMREIALLKNVPQEGEIDVDGLLEYLEKNNLPKKVALLEDATAVTRVIEYDAPSNSLRGLVSPFDASTGLPSGKFSATSGLEIAEHIKNGIIAKYVYVSLARPLHPCKH